MHPQPPLRTTHVTGRPEELLVYDRWGGFGRPVVLLHGLLLDRTMWWPAAAELVATSCTIVAPDLPGHGDSPPRDDYRLDHIARDLAGLVNDLGLHRAPIIVGHAASARLATAFADAYTTHCVLTLDEPPTDAAEVDDLISTVDLAMVPAILRPYAESRTDPALLRAYESWLAQPPAHRTQPALTGRGANRPAGHGGLFLPLSAPELFAAQLRAFL